MVEICMNLILEGSILNGWTYSISNLRMWERGWILLQRQLLEMCIMKHIALIIHPLIMNSAILVFCDIQTDPHVITIWKYGIYPIEPASFSVFS